MLLNVIGLQNMGIINSVFLVLLIHFFSVPLETLLAPVVFRNKTSSVPYLTFYFTLLIGIYIGTYNAYMKFNRF